MCIWECVCIHAHGLPFQSETQALGDPAPFQVKFCPSFQVKFLTISSVGVVSFHCWCSGELCSGQSKHLSLRMFPPHGLWPSSYVWKHLQAGYMCGIVKGATEPPPRLPSTVLGVGGLVGSS